MKQYSGILGHRGAATSAVAAAAAGAKAMALLAAAIIIEFGTTIDSARASAISPMTPDIIQYEPIQASADYQRREVMIPMRDGTKLFTVIVNKKGVSGAPILLSRTPYNTAKITWRIASQKAVDILPVADKEFIEDGYIRVYQDVRGQDRSEGDYVLVRPARGPLNDTGTDHATDAYDTIEWLIHNLPDSNGNVALQGSSYLGFTALMGLIDPHPALKAVVSMSPMVDGWLGDDWFHNGAFRQSSFNFVLHQMAEEKGQSLPIGDDDQYDTFLSAGSAGAFAQQYGLDAFPALNKMFQHPTYDDYWQGQALDKLLADRAAPIPTLLVMSQWDQEDNYGAPSVYRSLEPQDAENEQLFYALGPWRHSGVLHDGSALGHLDFGHDTALYFRTSVMKPFLDSHLRPDAKHTVTIAPVTTFATGINEWQSSEVWPTGQLTPIYLSENRSLSWSKPNVGADSFISDPQNPVPFTPRPLDMTDAEQWRTWRLNDQRFVEDREDVLVYRSAPLTEPLHVAGAPESSLWAATTGTDSDWVVKLIDQAPDGAQTMLGVEIFRGRYLSSFTDPEPLVADEPENYRFRLPEINHVFDAGHRIVIQVQSSLFPLYDRNPQRYVENIFFARPSDYTKATQTVYRDASRPSLLALPIVGNPDALSLQADNRGERP
ncbi:MAG: CocE/NonD family hydrolase [Pseudomonadota bacterium]